MKKTILALALMIMSTAVMAQSPIIESYMKQFKDNKDFIDFQFLACFSILSSLKPQWKVEIYLKSSARTTRGNLTNYRDSKEKGWEWKYGSPTFPSQ